MEPVMNNFAEAITPSAPHAPEQVDAKVEVQRLARLGQLDYAKQRKASARLLDIRTSELDVAVQEQRERMQAELESRLSEARQTAAPEPCNEGGFISFGDFTMSASGLFWSDPDPEKSSKIHIAGAFRVKAENRDIDSASWGVWLEWIDNDGKTHRHALPKRSLAGDGSEARQVLLDGGLYVNSGKRARELLTNYLVAVRTDDRATAVNRCGWHSVGDRRVYVLPDRAIGTSGGEHILLQTETPASAFGFGKRGTPEEWRAHIALKAEGNSRLVFAICAALAGTLLDVSGDESGGLNFEGKSRTGKTTALRVAASVWGPRDHLHAWRATANGLEAVAAAHSDNTLLLDEIGQMEAREAGEAVYMLSNGRGKARAQRSGGAKPSASWRVLFLSSGEIGISARLSEIGKRARAGHEVRLVGIPADAGRGLGVFENIHDAPTADIFSGNLRDAAGRYYGTAGPAFLESLIDLRNEEPTELAALIADVRQAFIKAHVPAGSSGQVLSVASRFALVAAAGELATKMELTGWRAEASIAAARDCFLAWLAGRGGSGDLESSDGIAQVRAFLTAHGWSRFPLLNTDDVKHVVNRAGFRRKVGEEEGESLFEYLIPSDTWKREVCVGLNPNAVAKALHAGGHLVTEGGKHLTAKVSLPGLGRPRCYIVRSSVMDDEEAAGADA
jgi:putative DNA primase/helicase